jgi:hypothetical protein
MRQRHDVDPVVPWGKTRSELREESIRVWTAVYEKCSAVELDEEGVALPDVEGTHAYPRSRRPEDGRSARSEKDDDERRARPERSPRDPRAGEAGYAIAVGPSDASAKGGHNA